MDCLQPVPVFYHYHISSVEIAFYFLDLLAANLHKAQLFLSAILMISVPEHASVPRLGIR